MRDEHDGAPRAFESADHIEQALHLARAERGGGLVENDEIGLERERLGDFDELPLGRGKVPGLRFERQRVLLAEIAEDLAGPFPHVPPRQSPGPAEIRKEDILDDGEVGREARLLHHHGDPGVERLARTADVERLAAIENVARIAADMPRNRPGTASTFPPRWRRAAHG